MQNLKKVVGIHPARNKSHNKTACAGNTHTPLQCRKTPAAIAERDLPPIISRAITRAASWHAGLFETLQRPALRQLLSELIRCANARAPGSDIWASNLTLAMRMGVSLATIKRGMNALVSAGWIDREQSRSAQNKFSGSCTRLRTDAIDSLGLALEAPSSIDFRGSKVSPTIGDRCIQSSSKRQDGPLNPKPPSPNSQNQSPQINHPRTTPPIGTPDETSCLSVEQPTAQTSHQSTASGKSHASSHPQAYLVPSALAPLLARLTRFEIYRLMGDARKHGHLLEDITTACEGHILTARSPLAYVRRLIRSDKDWRHIREIAQQDQEDKATSDVAASSRLKEKLGINTFMSKHQGQYLASTSTGRVYRIESESCQCWWPSTAGMAGGLGVVFVDSAFIAAVHAGKLVEMAAIDALAQIEAMAG